MGWSDWVMAQFDESELAEGKPKAEGCRRLVEKLCGPIVGRRTTILQIPCLDNDWHGVFQSEVTIAPHNTAGVEHTYVAVGDLHRDNVGDEKFLAFAVATGATRCEGLNYRKILGLDRCTSDELPQGGGSSAPPRGGRFASAGADPGVEMISTPQRKAIAMLVEKLDLSLQALVDDNDAKRLAKGLPAYGSLDRYSAAAAEGLLDRIHKFRPDPSAIPAEFLKTAPAEISS